MKNVVTLRNYMIPGDLEREIGRPSNYGAGRKALERLLEMVRSKDLDGLRQGFKYQLSQVDDPSDELEKVTDILEITRFGVMATPGLAVDGKVLVSGRVPTEAEIREMLG